MRWGKGLSGVMVGVGVGLGVECSGEMTAADN